MVSEQRLARYPFTPQFPGTVTYRDTLRGPPRLCASVFHPDVSMAATVFLHAPGDNDARHLMLR